MTHPCEKIAVTKSHEMSLAGKGKWRRPWQCLRVGTWNVLKRDVERLGIRNWRTKSMDRNGWRLSRPRRCMGCSAWDDDDDDDDAE
jgi:hypothetical protein